MPKLNGLPALASAVVATALISISGTIGLMQYARPFAIPAADKPGATYRLVTDMFNRLDGQLTTALGHSILCIEEMQALRKERTPSRLPAPAVKKAGG